MFRLSRILVAVVILFGLGLCLFLMSPPMQAVGDHVVISEIQIAGDGAYDEFVELYNPTDVAVDLEGWRLRKTSANGSSPANLASTIYGTIPAHGYFLIAHPNYNGSAYADLLYTATTSGLANNNHVILYSDAGVTEVDRVGLGEAGTPEGTAVDNPAAHGSVERKAVVESTSATMGMGGLHEFWGNGYDSDNNANDFVQREVAGPQNRTWPTEQPAVTEPSATPTQESSPTPTEEPLPTPTEEPSPTPEPTEEPTPTPTEEPSPTPEPTEEPYPTPEPTEEPTPTPEPIQVPSPTPEPTLEPLPTAEPTPEPTLEPEPTPTPPPTPPGRRFEFLNVVCERRYIPFRLSWRTIYMPHTVCWPRWWVR